MPLPKIFDAIIVDSEREIPEEIDSHIVDAVKERETYEEEVTLNSLHICSEE